jgi:hypothetical protein
MRPALCAVLVSALLLALTPTAIGAGPALPQGRYTGQTGDGHVFQFTVERSRKPGFPRKITHFWMVYDIAGCRSGPVRQPFLASVHYGAAPSKRGTFSRLVGHSNAPNTVRLSLKGRFSTSAASASGSFKVGVVGRCPITADTPSLTFHVTRR